MSFGGNNMNRGTRIEKYKRNRKKERRKKKKDKKKNFTKK
jgi:hypothetical protein